MRSLNLDQLRALLRVIELGSFSAAARQLNLTQPAVSLQIRELERRFGVRLIERLGKRAHTTAPGATLVEAARKIFHECELMDAAMRPYRDGWIGRVQIGATNTMLVHVLPPILRELSLASIRASTCTSPTCPRARAWSGFSRTGSISRS